MRRVLLGGIAVTAGVIMAVSLIVGFAAGHRIAPQGGFAGGSLRRIAAPEPAPVVPAEYRRWITRSAKRCRTLTPQLVASQLYRESRLDPRAVSTTGALGIAQFMPETWKTWGRDANRNGKTSPYDPADAIMAQGRLMCSLLRKAGKTKWRPGPASLALAGYNAGWGAVTEHQGIPPYPETEKYVESVMELYRAKVPALDG
jgi:soluble lytic murein transglycosylase-like protein